MSRIENEYHEESLRRTKMNAKTIMLNKFFETEQMITERLIPVITAKLKAELEEKFVSERDIILAQRKQLKAEFQAVEEDRKLFTKEFGTTKEDFENRVMTMVNEIMELKNEKTDLG
jgi:hypothetical protein